MNARETYPALMAYIDSRNALPTTARGTDQLRLDEAAAADAGGFADVAAGLERAQADCAAAQAPGRETYPYDSAMCEWLGLPVNRGTHESTHGYYMASRIRDYAALGTARREAERLIGEGRPLRTVAARAKATGKPVRYRTFVGPDQIKVEGDTVTASNGKVRVRLSSNWSVETCLVRVATALRTGVAYGEAA